MATRNAQVPTPVAPMLATLGIPPAPSGNQVVEFKWDGVRAICDVRGGQLGLFSRNQRPITSTYPELANLPELLGGRDATLDGEIVALDADGRPRFGLLQERLHVHNPRPQLIAAIPVIFYVFDLVRLKDGPTTALPYLQRRQLLESLELAGPHVAVPPHFADVDPATMLDVARQHHLEGIVTKRADGLYRPGARSPTWIKTPLRANTEVVIGGWKPGEGRRAATIGALLVGAHDDTGRLVWLGNVGTGFTATALQQLLDCLGPLEQKTSPFSDTVPRAYSSNARYVKPVLVGDVEYRELTTDQRLRHPAWKGLRADKTAHEIRHPRLDRTTGSEKQ